MHQRIASSNIMVITQMNYKSTQTGSAFPPIVMKRSKYSPNQCVFRDDRNGVWLYQANCMEFLDEVLKKYPEGKFDMIFADPPYFLSNGGITCHAGKMTRVDKGNWDRSNGPKHNHEFNISWIERCQKALRPNGTLWVSGTQHVIYSVGYAMQQLEMKILNDITWEKRNPPPNLSRRYFTHSTETIIWAAKTEKSKHCFNYQEMREINGGKQMKTVWSFIPPQREEKKFGKHPTQKPVALLERIIMASTNEGDLIFDPFSGSSTTGVAAVKLGRKFVGTELEKEFIDISVKRFDHSIHFHQLSLETAG